MTVTTAVRAWVVTLAVSAAGGVYAQGAPATPEQIEFFEKSIRPILAW